MALHPGYNSSQLSSLKVAKIQQQIELGSFETTLRNLAVMNNATQLLNSTCNEVTEIGAVVVPPSSGSSSSSDGYSTGVVVGIVLGVVFGLLILSCVLYLRLRRRRRDIRKRPLSVDPGTAADIRYY